MKRTGQQKFGKKVILSVAVAVLLFAANTNAQTLYLGLTGGPQYTTISSNDETFKGGVAYNAAITAEMRFSQKFGLELQYGLSTVNASTSYKDSLSYYDYVQRYENNYTFNSSYLQGHLLFKYYIRLGGDPITPYDRPEGSGNYLYFFAGPYVGSIFGSGALTHVGRTGTQVVKKHINNTTPWDSSVQTTTVNLDDNSVQESFDRTVITNLDLGLTLGAGVSLRLSPDANLSFSLRYSTGLVSIDNPSVAAPQQTANGFMLGHAGITVSNTGKATGVTYTPADAFNNFIALNIGINYKLFGDSY